ncbi:MAG: hypothetical protein ABFC89_11425, partial [Methanospirillum sp.]
MDALLIFAAIFAAVTAFLAGICVYFTFYYHLKRISSDLSAYWADNKYRWVKFRKSLRHKRLRNRTGETSAIAFSELGQIDDDERVILKRMVKIIAEEREKNRILVIGDVMLDHIMYCKKTPLLQSQRHNVDEDYSYKRPEILKERKELGGAAHVAYACSVVSEILLFGIIGDDGQGRDLKTAAIERIGTTGAGGWHLRELAEFITTTKIYIDCSLTDADNGPKKIIRINRELIESDGRAEILKVKESLVREVENYLLDDRWGINGIVFKDHEKGYLSEELLHEIVPIVNRKLSEKNKPDKPDEFFVFIDPKYNWKKFTGLDTVHGIIPTVKEAAGGILPGNTVEIDKRDKEHSLRDDDWQK